MSIKNRRNYYRILQVQPDAPVEIIRISYRTLMRELKQHPDLGGDHEKASILNEAYWILNDHVRRAEYDKELFQKYTKKILPKEQNTEERPVSNQIPEKAVVNQTNSHTPHYEQRRKVRRMKRHEKVCYYSARHHLYGTADMLDVSTDGVRFVCPQELHEKVHLQLKSKLFRAEAQVMSSQKCILHGKTNYCVGAQFTSVSFNKPKGSFVSSRV